MKTLLGITSTLVAMLLIAPAMGLTTITSVDMMLNFDDGNTSNSVDGYKGTVGQGWKQWEEQRSRLAGEPQTNIVVRNSSELPGIYDDNYAELVPGSGNYLYIDAQMNETNTCSLTIARDFGGKLGIDRTKPYTIEFLYRVDEDTFSSDFTTSVDQYQIYDWPTIRGGTTLGIGWGVKASGTNNIWRFYNGDGRNGTTNSTFIESGIPIVADHVFKFEISVDPVNSSWDGKVTDLTTGLWGGGTDMGYRFDSTGDPPATPSTLMQFHTRGDTEGEERRYSIDAIRVQQPSCSWTVGGMSEVAAHFNEGETDQMVDGFTGKAGDGWNGPWKTRETYCTLTTTVKGVLENPLHATSGNYLAMVSDCSGIGSQTYAIGGVTRDYARVNEAGIDWTKDYTLQFSVRIDDDLSTFDAQNDSYQIFDQSYERAGTTGDTIWSIRCEGDDNGYWSFADGSSTVESTIALMQDGVYDFTLDIDVDGRTYSVNVTDGFNTYTNTFDWRGEAALPGGILHFMARGDAADDIRAWSIDEIIITQNAAIPGDANGDNIVDNTDASTLADHWGQTIAGGASVGDFNNDGVVDIADASILAANWGNHNESESSTVPEPGSLILLGFGVLILAVRRCREH